MNRIYKFTLLSRAYDYKQACTILMYIHDYIAKDYLLEEGLPWASLFSIMDLLIKSLAHYMSSYNSITYF